MNKKPNAYRVVSANSVKAYQSGDFSSVRNLDGAYFNRVFKDMNEHNYLDDVKYLHFFRNLGDANDYLQEMQSVAPLVRFKILKFCFDDDLLKNVEGYGAYYKKAYGRIVRIREYVVPLELYNAEENFIGQVEPSEFEGMERTFVEDKYY